MWNKPTGYPWDGKDKMYRHSEKVELLLRVRIPGWAPKTLPYLQISTHLLRDKRLGAYSISVNAPKSQCEANDGYATLVRNWESG